MKTLPSSNIIGFTCSTSSSWSPRASRGATEILITQAYKFAFERYRYGYAAAYSVIIFLILLAYGTVQNRATRATEGI